MELNVEYKHLGAMKENGKFSMKELRKYNELLTAICIYKDGNRKVVNNEN